MSHNGAYVKLSLLGGTRNKQATAFEHSEVWFECKIDESHRWIHQWRGEAYMKGYSTYVEARIVATLASPLNNLTNFHF